MTTPVGHSAAPSLTPHDLAELIESFNEVTARLQSSHEVLTAEVARLNAQLRDANAQIERSQRLAELGGMAAGIAHEVRNPLGGITLYAQMLRDDLADRPAQQRIAEKIISASRSLAQVVTDVLTFAKEFRVRTGPVCARELAERALEACCHDGVPRWREVEIRLPEGPVEFTADEGLITQAITNIVRNALQAMGDLPGPHRLRIDAGRTGLADSSGRVRPAVVIAIADSGPGIDAEVARRMFNPFFTTRASGTGLGLAIVHRIMDAHGGFVAVRNNRDLAGPGAPEIDRRGARVELAFPERLPADAGPAGELAPDPAVPGEVIVRRSAQEVPLRGLDSR
jgi:signal transduction histidine kinase